jgi:hypothetical protein
MMACREVGLCRRGHLLDEANRYVRPTGVVSCRTCNREDVMAKRRRGKPKPMCECGRGRVEFGSGHRGGPKLAGCGECNAIDGTSPQQRDIVQALRIAGQELTTTEIAIEVGAGINSVLVTGRRLEERGILVSRLGPYPGETVNRSGWAFGRWNEREMKGGKPPVLYWRIARRRS